MGMRRNSASRHMRSIAELLLRFRRLDMYDVAARLGVSPSYAYHLMRMFAANPLVIRDFERRGLRVIFDGGRLRAENLKSLMEAFEEVGGEG